MIIAAVGLLILGAVFSAEAQTPQQAFLTQRNQLQKQARTAFDGEMVREKAGDCPKADNTRDIVDCLGKEIDTSTANYKTYAGALRSMLSSLGDPSDDFIGPTGKPLTAQEQVKSFDQVEATWTRYREAMCAGAYGLYKGGTVVNIMSGSCELMMLRSHMRELNRVYGKYLSH